MRRIINSVRCVERNPGDPSAPLAAINGVLEAEIDADLWVHWAAHFRVEIRLNPLQLEAGRAANMEVGVESSFAAVNHQNLHLPHGKVLDVVLAGSRFLRLALASHARLGVLGCEDAGLAHR